MQPRDTGLLPAALHHLPHAAVGHRTLTPQPERISRAGERMLRPRPDVPAQGLPGPVTKRCRPFTPTFAQDKGNVLLEAQILQGDPDELRDPEARVQEKAEDRRVTPLLEPAALARVQHPLNF